MSMHNFSLLFLPQKHSYEFEQGALFQIIDHNEKLLTPVHSFNYYKKITEN